MANNQEEIIVSIQCMVYNHEPYLRQCLDGFVMQKTDFKFEAIVHDDFSTDGSAAIIREYAERYPEIIKPIYETHNQYSKRDGSLERIMTNACRGKYIAICEGDDYWTDPMKLQKQVMFLERHQDFTMCFHRVNIKFEYEQEHKSLYNLYSHLEEREYFGNELLAQWTVPTTSIMYDSNKVVVNIDPRFMYGDIIIVLSCIKYGRVYCLNDRMATYRRNPGGVSTKLYDYMKLIKHYEAILETFDNYHQTIKALIVNTYIRGFASNLTAYNLFDVIYNLLKFHPRYFLQFIYQLFKVSLSKLKRWNYRY